MKRRNAILGAVNRLAQLPMEIFEIIMRSMLGVSTRRIRYKHQAMFERTMFELRAHWGFNPYSNYDGLSIPYEAPSEMKENFMLRSTVRQAKDTWVSSITIGN